MTLRGHKEVIEIQEHVELEIRRLGGDMHWKAGKTRGWEARKREGREGASVGKPADEAGTP